MIIVNVYDIFNNEHPFTVKDIAKGREYAKRIIMEGLWYIDGDEEVFLPVHQIVKVKVTDSAPVKPVVHRRRKRHYTKRVKVVE